LLVNHFVAKFNKKIGKQIDIVSNAAQNTLQQYHWPGNVRELESAIERAVILSAGTPLQILDRFDSFDKRVSSNDRFDGVNRRVPREEPSVKALVELEHEHIINVLQQTNWRIEGQQGAAVILGLNPSTLRARMRKYVIERH
jgi:transcriptional regulator with GAF, ATPase, and Fis domain